MGGDIGADGIGQGYRLQGQNVGESKLGDLWKVEAVALEYLERSVNGHMPRIMLRDEHFSVPYHN